jgi:hypothetical protein
MGLGSHNLGVAKRIGQIIVSDVSEARIRTAFPDCEIAAVGADFQITFELRDLFFRASRCPETFAAARPQYTRRAHARARRRPIVRSVMGLGSHNLGVAKRIGQIIVSDVGDAVAAGDRVPCDLGPFDMRLGHESDPRLPATQAPAPSRPAIESANTARSCVQLSIPRSSTTSSRASDGSTLLRDSVDPAPANRPTGDTAGFGPQHQGLKGFVQPSTPSLA